MSVRMLDFRTVCNTYTYTKI